MAEQTVLLNGRVQSTESIPYSQLYKQDLLVLSNSFGPGRNLQLNAGGQGKSLRKCSGAVPGGRSGQQSNTLSVAKIFEVFEGHKLTEKQFPLQLLVLEHTSHWLLLAA